MILNFLKTPSNYIYKTCIFVCIFIAFQRNVLFWCTDYVFYIKLWSCWPPLLERIHVLMCVWEREVTNCGFLVNLVHALQLFMVKGKHCFQSSTTHWAVASGNYCSKCWVGSGWFLVQDDFLTIYPYMVTYPTAFLSLQSFLTFYSPRKTCIFIWPLLVFLLYGGLPENWIPINKGSEESKNPHNGPTIFPF